MAGEYPLAESYLSGLAALFRFVSWPECTQASQADGATGEVRTSRWSNSGAKSAPGSSEGVDVTGRLAWYVAGALLGGARPNGASFVADGVSAMRDLVASGGGDRDKAFRGVPDVLLSGN